MAFHNDVKRRTYIASTDLNGHLNHAVKFQGDLKVEGGTAGVACGVLLNKPLAGEHASVAIEGEVEVRAGVAITAGAYVTSATSGWVIPVATTTVYDILGRCVRGAASGMLADIEMNMFKGPTA